MNYKAISKASLGRLPAYLNYLKTLPDATNISSAAIAAALSLGEVQVRKDLAGVSCAGKPKTGYLAANLIRDIEEFLGYNNVKDAIIVGAGKLGKALLNYSGFARYGLNIVASFDINAKENDKKVFSLEKLEDLCRRMNIKIGIITVPAQSAQSVCDLLVANEILAIWNFAPVHLSVPKHILLQNENMAVSLALLSNHLKKTLIKK